MDCLPEMQPSVSDNNGIGKWNRTAGEGSALSKILRT